MTSRPFVLLATPGPLADAVAQRLVSLAATAPAGSVPVIDPAAPAGLASLLAGDPVVAWLDTAPTVPGQPAVGPAVAADVIVRPGPGPGPEPESANQVDALASELSAEIIRRAALVGSRHRLVTEHVELGPERRYPVVVGRGAVSRLPALLPPGVKRVAVVTQEGIGFTVDPGVEHRVFVVEDGEEAKRFEVVADLASRFAQWGLTRRDAVVSVGGGVVSDLAGFVAATYHRGISVVHVSTTLLGQIDAAIGGKCGVNLPEGKNLLGAFKQPAAVVCDIDSLATLPPAELASGMGELAKYHFLGGGELDQLALPERVAACVRLKADVVASDETEGGLRAILNYGHTLAHALEIATDYGLRHGEAVAVGLLYAAELAHAMGRIDADRVAEHRRVVEVYGLRTRIPAGLDPDELVHLFTRDKKAIAGITFVLDGPRGVEPLVVEDTDLLRATLEAVA